MYRSKFGVREVAWKAMSLSLIYIIIEEKETHNLIEALIKKNFKFYFPLIQTDESEI
jgi:hypothetical protein